MTTGRIIVVALVTTVLGACTYRNTAVRSTDKEVFISGVRLRATTLPAATSRQITVQVELYNPPEHNAHARLGRLRRYRHAVRGRCIGI